MFVIADIEWITNHENHHSPTQLSAVRVDERWNVIATFNSFIRPRDNNFYVWDHMAYTGGTSTDFIYARSAYTVFSDFQNWLKKDDILLWWHEESEKLFKRLVGLILKTPEYHKAISFGNHVYAFIAGQHYARANPYIIAEDRGIVTISELRHNSKNDVRVMRELMAKLQYPQAKLLDPVVIHNKKSKSGATCSKLPYQYDHNTNLIHIKGCHLIADVATQGFETLKNPIRKGFQPCDCCKNEYKTVLKERNMDILKRSQYKYVYSPDSSVFHKCTCSTILSAQSIMGTQKYETVINTGRTPCKFCNPTPENTFRPKYTVNRFYHNTEPKVSKEVVKAIKRQKTAFEERNQRLKDETLTAAEKKDVYTLTQPRFAFWVGHGYQTFHLHSCSKLHEVNNLTGFGSFREAISAGYTPCKKCKPTPKHDMNYSIPITNRIREDEKIEDLDSLCASAGYPHHKDDLYFYLETLVGKWRINLASSPVRLEHINLVKSFGSGDTYHVQPRLFLSLIDTFDYIKRHDDQLLMRAEKNMFFLNSVAEG